MLERCVLWWVENTVACRRKRWRFTDRAIHLPMLGMSNSLNVPTAISVVLYDLINKLMTGESDE